MTRNELDDARKLIERAVIEHMPTTAAASGLCSLVDYEPWVEATSQRFPLDARPDNLGITPLLAWLKANGIECGRSAGLALRARWLKERMRAECEKGTPVVTFADTRETIRENF